MNPENHPIANPMPVKIIIVLNAIMCVLPFLFYYVITTNGIKIGDLNPIWMVYTGVGYIISFAFVRYFVVNRKLLGARIMFFINILISIPAGAYLGILVAAISLALSFFNKPTRGYFNT